MKQWIVEDWAFEITVAQAQPCRLGFEKGDRFNCKYECPAGFYPKTIPVLYTLCEIVCGGGNYLLHGSQEPYEIDFPCADGCVKFHLSARYFSLKKENRPQRRKFISEHKKEITLDCFILPAVQPRVISLNS